MTSPTTHFAQAIELIARESASDTSDTSEASAASAASATTESVVKRARTPSKHEVDAIYDDLIARLAVTLATLSSDDVDTTPTAFRASALRPRPRS